MRCPSTIAQDFLSISGETGMVRILVVDDEPAVRRAVHRALTLEGYEVRVAGEGLEALDVLASEQVDAVVLDLLMPGLDGLEVCRRMRAEGDATPVLMLTVRNLVSDRVAGLDAGADDYRTKASSNSLEVYVGYLRRKTEAGGEPRLVHTVHRIGYVLRES